MPALNFKKRFMQPIRAGTKTHTIRSRVPTGFTLGHWMPLYYGQRTAQCELIGSGRADRTHEVRIDIPGGRIDAGLWRYTDAGALDGFAVSDGFDDWSDMCAFWAKTHPGQAVFSGHLIGWGEFCRAKRLGAPGQGGAIW